MNTSPITSWEGAEAVFSYAGGGAGVSFWYWVAVALCVGTILISIKSENEAEKKAHEMLPFTMRPRRGNGHPFKLKG